MRDEGGDCELISGAVEFRGTLLKLAEQEHAAGDENHQENKAQRSLIGKWRRSKGRRAGLVRRCGVLHVVLGDEEFPLPASALLFPDPSLAPHVLSPTVLNLFAHGACLHLRFETASACLAWHALFATSVTDLVDLADGTDAPYSVTEVTTDTLQVIAKRNNEHCYADKRTHLDEDYVSVRAMHCECCGLSSSFMTNVTRQLRGPSFLYPPLTPIESINPYMHEQMEQTEQGGVRVKLFCEEDEEEEEGDEGSPSVIRPRRSSECTSFLGDDDTPIVAIMKPIIPMPIQLETKDKMTPSTGLSRLHAMLILASVCLWMSFFAFNSERDTSKKTSGIWHINEWQSPEEPENHLASSTANDTCAFQSSPFSAMTTDDVSDDVSVDARDNFDATFPSGDLASSVNKGDSTGDLLHQALLAMTMMDANSTETDLSLLSVSEGGGGMQRLIRGVVLLSTAPLAGVEDALAQRRHRASTASRLADEGMDAVMSWLKNIREAMGKELTHASVQRDRRANAVTHMASSGCNAVLTGSHSIVALIRSMGVGVHVSLKNTLSDVGETAATSVRFIVVEAVTYVRKRLVMFDTTLVGLQKQQRRRSANVITALKVVRSQCEEVLARRSDAMARDVNRAALVGRQVVAVAVRDIGTCVKAAKSIPWVLARKIRSAEEPVRAALTTARRGLRWSARSGVRVGQAVVVTLTLMDAEHQRLLGLV